MCSTCGASPPGPLRIERRPLADPEAVLLVDHREGERAEAGQSSSISAWVPTRRPGWPPPRRVERVRSGAACGVALVSRATGSRLGRRAGSQGGEVLLGQGLGRRHQRRLMPGLEPPAASRRGRHGLAAAHLSHQQPLHRRLGPGRSASISSSAASWSPVSSKGSESSQRLHPLAAGRQRRRAALVAAPGPPRRERGLVEEELLEGEAPARLGGLRLVAGSGS